MLVELLLEQMNDLKGVGLGLSWRLWQMMPAALAGPHGGGPGSRWRYQTTGTAKEAALCRALHSHLEYPDSWICLWIHDGWARISQWSKTTCFSLCCSRSLFQGEKFPVETREPSCVWVLQTASRFPSDVLVNGKNTALSRSLLALSLIQLPLIINVY